MKRRTTLGKEGARPRSVTTRGAKSGSPTLTLLGVGAMASPRFAPAGLLLEYRRVRVMFDGGPGAVPEGTLDACLVTDIRAELIARIRELARERGVEPAVSGFTRGALTITPHHVIHTSRPTYGYLIETPARRAVWAQSSFASRAG